MLGLIARAGRSVASSAYDQFLTSVYDGVLENLRNVEASNRLVILDRLGERCAVTRVRSYAVRWAELDFLPEDRISVGETGIITSFQVVGEPAVGHEILEGGVGHHHVVFRVRAPGMRPDYLVRRTAAVTVTVLYEARDVYIRDSSPFLSWVYRFPRGKPLPGLARLTVELPQDRPVLEPPRVYRLGDLALAERALTDLTIDRSDRWRRTSGDTRQSRLLFERNGTYLQWTVTPSRVNSAFKLEWDWWPRTPTRPN